MSSSFYYQHCAHLTIETLSPLSLDYRNNFIVVNVVKDRFSCPVARQSHAILSTEASAKAILILEVIVVSLWFEIFNGNEIVV